MINEESLKDWEESLNYLRFLLRNEKELTTDGWLSKSDFLLEIAETIEKLSTLSGKVKDFIKK